MSEANRVGIAYRKQSAFGTQATGVLQKLRFNSANITQQTQFITSNEIDATRQVLDEVRVGRNSPGSIAFEFSAGAHDELMGDALRDPGNISEATITGTIYSQAASDNSLNRASGSFVSDGIKAGALINISGFTGGGYNGWAFVKSVVALKIILGGVAAVDDSAGESVTIVQQRGWNAAIVVTDTVFAQVASGNKITRSGGSFVSDGFVVGTWIKTAGFTGGGYNGIAKVVAVSATELTCSNATFVNDSAGESVTITQGAYIRNGVAKSFHTIEEEFSDLASTFSIFQDQIIDTYAMSFTSRQIATGSFAMKGTKETAASSTVGSAYREKPAFQVLNAVDNIVRVQEAGTAVSLTAIDFSLGNNVRELDPDLGSLDASGMGDGEVKVTGKVRAYFKDQTIRSKYLNNQYTQLAWIARDAASIEYVFDLPSVKLTSAPINVSGKNTDLMLDCDYTSRKDPTLGYTFQIARFPG